MPPVIAIAVVLALALELTLREPPARFHPVALFGRVVESVSGAGYGGPAPKLAGVVVAVGLSLGLALVVYAAVWLTAGIHWAAAVVLAGLALWSVTSLRMLLDVAAEVIEASNGGPEDLAAAREALPALVGRPPEDLSPALLRSAAVESLGENLSDGLVGPLLAFAVGAVVSLPAAAAAAAFVKAVNTMDSMLGYHDVGDFGWASARLDDLVMWLPARVTAALLGLAAGDPDAPLRARRYAHVPPSPNAGWPMGALAAALNVRLEKPGVYVLNEIAEYPTVADGREAIVAVRRAGLAAYGGVAGVGVVLWL